MDNIDEKNDSQNVNISLEDEEIDDENNEPSTEEEMVESGDENNDDNDDEEKDDDYRMVKNDFESKVSRTL